MPVTVMQQNVSTHLLVSFSIATIQNTARCEANNNFIILLVLK